MKKLILLIILIIIVLGGGFLIWQYKITLAPLVGYLESEFFKFRYSKLNKEEIARISSFEECVVKGYSVLESYPRQCQTPNGRTFTEDIGNAIEKMDLIRVETPRPNTVITSPLEIKGEARGFWFFEASFPVRLFDANGKELEVSPPYVQTKGEWMTEDFVPFEAKIEFQKPETKKGILILEKDNPSGLPENDDELRIPVFFRN